VQGPDAYTDSDDGEIKRAGPEGPKRWWVWRILRDCCCLSGPAAPKISSSINAAHGTSRIPYA